MADIEEAVRRAIVKLATDLIAFALLAVAIAAILIGVVFGTIWLLDAIWA